MAGIVGVARSNEERLIEQALATIAHRGNAGRMIASHDAATFGQVWPHAQAQSAINIRRHRTVLHGEIHNWPELAVGATCPLEALENAYRSQGPAVVGQLDGPFALSIAGSEGVFLARDMLGRSPLYLGRHQGAVCFASELKALAGWAEDIREFPPGHYYDPQAGLVEYARLELRPPLDSPAQHVATELRARLVASVRKRVSPGQAGAWLSGGLDSATMTALARRQVPVLHTFAVGVAGAPDLGFARAVADFVGTEHHERVCTVDEMLAVLPEVIYHLESFDALLVRSSITNFLVGRLAADHVPAVLSGEGGDELFAGYAYLKHLDPAELPDELIDITGRLHNTALQRVDRCSAGHGLVARTAFLDREVVDYALRIPPQMKISDNGAAVEKWILRRAMEGLLPPQVLNRPKAKFWEGAGVGDLLAARAEHLISDAEFQAQRRLPDGGSLNCKEELFYYRIFRDYFGAAISHTLVGRTKGAPVVQ
ncbi:MAG TPA: asparagine synthase-related protein [Armatimonadota bacterium]|nr:asparagine synthase-related protein [Armatimonadota bacterium]